MLVYNTDPLEGPLEMTGPNMEIPVPSAMIGFNESVVLRRALARAHNGVLRLHVFPQVQSKIEFDLENAEVDFQALVKQLQRYLEIQHGCIQEECLDFVHPGTFLTQLGGAT